MKDYNDEYFFVMRDQSSRFPSLILDDVDNHYSIKMLQARPLECISPLHLKFNRPPRKPIMADFHRLNAPTSVVTEKLKIVFESLDLNYIQLLPVLIRDKSDDIIEGYHILKVFNSVECVDMEKSEYETMLSGDILAFNKLVLDNEKLDQIPLKDRLIINLAEHSTSVLYHISVVERILETAPTGLVVYRVSKWDSEAPFIEAYVSYLNGEDEE